MGGGSSHQTVRMIVDMRQRNNEYFQSAGTNAAMKMAGDWEEWTSSRTDADWSVTTYHCNALASWDIGGELTDMGGRPHQPNTAEGSGYMARRRLRKLRKNWESWGKPTGDEVQAGLWGLRKLWLGRAVRLIEDAQGVYITNCVNLLSNKYFHIF